MARGFITAQFTGNLTSDPQLRQVNGANGPTSVAALRLAATDRKRQGNQWVDAPVYIDLELWGTQADNAARYLSKGSAVSGHGTLKYHEWHDKDTNAKRNKHYIKVDQLVYGARETHTPPAPAPASQLAGPPASGARIPQPISQSVPSALTPPGAPGVPPAPLTGAGAPIAGPPATEDDIPF